MDNLLNVTSDTIWNKEIYSGLKELLQKLFGENFNVVIRKPDEDFKLEEFPCAVLQIPYYTFSIDRWRKKDRYVVAYNEDGWLVDAPPLPFDLHLQMDFYAKRQEDMDTLQIKWLSYFGRDLWLPVINRGGKKDEVLFLPQGSARRLDEVYGKNRLLRLIQNFWVFARIEEHDAREFIKVPKKVKILTYLMERVNKNEKISTDKRIGTTPDIYTVRREGKTVYNTSLHH